MDIYMEPMRTNNTKQKDDKIRMKIWTAISFFNTKIQKKEKKKRI